MALISSALGAGPAARKSAKASRAGVRFSLYLLGASRGLVLLLFRFFLCFSSKSSAGQHLFPGAWRHWCCSGGVEGFGQACGGGLNLATTEAAAAAAPFLCRPAGYRCPNRQQGGVLVWFFFYFVLGFFFPPSNQADDGGSGSQAGQAAKPVGE